MIRSATSGPQPRNLSLDALKIVMAMMVVGLHAGFLRDVHPGLSHFFTNGLFRVAVPTFLVINGYFLERQLDQGLGAWVRRVALLYGLWMAIYAPLWLPGALAVPSFGREVLLFGYYPSGICWRCSLAGCWWRRCGRRARRCSSRSGR